LSLQAKEKRLVEDALSLVYAAIDEVNEQSGDGVLIVKQPETRLLGSDQSVDSLTFVNLVVAIEEQIQQTRGVSVVLVDEDSMGMQEHPFRTVESLAKYVERVLSKQQQP
jgi:acyl carrier protein